MTREEENKLEGDCVLAPDQPLPADVVGRYSPARDFHAENDIIGYMAGQARDEMVLNVELVKTEHVAGRAHEVWDVTTDKGRWWVLTNPTNLYSQTHFRSLDYTLSFHIGLMMRVIARSHREAEEEDSPFTEVLRRFGQAEELAERAIEAVDFQSVGMQLRECLISLVAVLHRRVEVESDVLPKMADVTGWSALFLQSLCPGDKNDELRNYVKASVEKAWPLVNWLTHHRNANKTASLIAIQAVDNIIDCFGCLLMRENDDTVDQCPRCSSRNIRTHYDIGIEPDGAYFQSCGACGWDGHPGYPEEGTEGTSGIEET